MLSSLTQRGSVAVLFFALALSAASSFAMRVDNFVLLDHKGDAHDLYYYNNSPAIVIMVQGNGLSLIHI